MSITTTLSEEIEIESVNIGEHLDCDAEGKVVGQRGEEALRVEVDFNRRYGGTHLRQ